MPVRTLLRLSVLPFIATISLVGLLRQWVLFNWSFVRYGGEIISYKKDNSRRTISEVYEKLEELTNKS